MTYTWKELEMIADDLCAVRDNHFKEFSIGVIVKIVRNIHVIEQELRFFNETRNFLRKNYDDDKEYEAKLYELRNTLTTVTLRMVTMEELELVNLSSDALEKITPMLGG